MKKLLTLASLFYLLALNIVLAQPNIIRGTVVSADDGMPIIGATILVPSTSTSTHCMNTICPILYSIQ